MIKFFGLPIIIALGIGYLLPYYGLKLSPYAFIVLFLMMTFSSLDIKWSYLKKTLEYKKELTIGLFLLFLFFPLAQWFLAKLFLTDESFILGTVFSSLCPIALVAPNFAKLHKSDEPLTYLFMIFSMLIFPFILFPLNQSPQFKAVLIDALLLVFFPILIASSLNLLLPRLSIKLKKIATEFNMFAIAFLAFIYLGSSISKLNLEYTPIKEIFGIITVLAFQDFGVYFLARFILGNIFEAKIANALAISLSMKNIAVAGGVLLFIDPKASMASALGFLVHAALFSFIATQAPRPRQ